MIVYDAHAHAGNGVESALRQRLGIRTMISAGNPEQAGIAFETARAYPVHTVTCGLHPWYAHRHSPDEMLPFMVRTPIVGEIGMDSVWCDVPMEVQRAAFIRQLDMAREMRKPVVLHTKGCEGEIADIIAGYDLAFIVHWYSGDAECLRRYLDMNCYFTVGPDVGINPLVGNVARLAPTERILFETDGMAAVSWAIGQTPVESLPDVLLNSAHIAARIRNIPACELIETANANYARLLKHDI